MSKEIKEELQLIAVILLGLFAFFVGIPYLVHASWDVTGCVAQMPEGK